MCTLLPGQKILISMQISSHNKGGGVGWGVAMGSDGNRVQSTCQTVGKQPEMHTTTTYLYVVNCTNFDRLHLGALLYVKLMCNL